MAKLCQGNNYVLVNIKSPEELKHLTSLLLYFQKYFETKNIVMDMNVFIGLSRYVDFSGRLKEQWTDGTLLTYTAWDEGEPSDTRTKECTMMKLDTYDGTQSWFTTQCDFIIERETIYVCESNLKSSAQTANFVDFTDIWLVDEIDNRMDPAMMFKCLSGEWMSHMVRCNGLRECADASDEFGCPTSSARCDENKFTCTDGQCIHISQVCDHKADCSDLLDEYCTYPECDGENEFTCQSGQCIPLSQRCDSIPDCIDGSDEISCASCNQEKAFQCGDTCISLRLVCDKMNDCLDAADERSCDRKYETCDDFIRDGITSDGEYFTDGDLHIQCLFGTNITRMVLLNSDWKFDGERKFRIIIPNSFTAATIQGYYCEQWFYMVAHRERQHLSGDKMYTLRLGGYHLHHRDSSVFVINYHPEVLSFDFIFKSEYIENAPYRAGESYSVTVLQLIGGVVLEIHDNFTSSDDRIVIGDIDCLKELIEPEPFMSCGKGVNAISREKQCLFVIDHNGLIDGCRSLNHLQDCENFICPWDHFKCANSYCVPYMYVCNGNVDCPNGEDERICDCSYNKSTIIGIIVPGLSYIQAARSNKLFEIAFRLGGSFYTDEEHVYVLKVDKGQGPFLLTIESTQVLSKSERATKIHQSHNIKEGENILQTVFGEMNSESLGLVWISDDANLNDVERYLTVNIRNKTESVNLQRIIIDSQIKEEVFSKPSSNGYDMEITLRNQDVLGTLGASLFSDLCKDKASQCRGHFRCRLSMVCIPVNQVCDNETNCPFGDDEHYCNFKCPKECNCNASILNCSKVYTNYTIDISPETRVIDASYTNRLCVDILRDQMYNLILLTKLDVSNCELKEIDRFSFEKIQNLLTLDISFNKLEKLTRNTFVLLSHLQFLYLTGNRNLKEIEPGAFDGLNIKSLSINHANIKTLVKNTFSGLNLTKLDLSKNKLETVENLAFNLLRVRYINIENNDITEFSKGMFEGVETLDYLKTSSFKYCCVKPPYLSEDSCYPLKDEFSSCEHLMRNISLKALLWTIGSLALIGNVLSILYRLIYDRQRLKLGYGVFVTNLGISDLLMGIYLLIIATADKIFEGSYIEFDEGWRQGWWCQFAGMLSTLSSEASVLFMILITLDRLLIVKYPFGDIRFRTRSAVVSAVGCWLAAFAIAVFPLLFRGYFKNFYGKSAVCLALPLTRDRPPGWLYSILIFIGFNMVTFILIGFGQWLIYKEIKKTAKVVKHSREHAARTNDLKITRNLLLLVLTDFMCWFPIGLMGFLSLSGSDIPGVVYSWTAVLILPINSALNPFLYTFMSIIGKKNLQPRVDEQDHLERKQVLGETMLSVTRFICTNSKRTINKSSTLTEILEGQKLTVQELGFLVHNIITYLAVLEDCGLALPTVSERQILLHLDKNKQVKRNVLFIGKPVLCIKKTDLAERIYKFGLFLERVLSTIASDQRQITE